MRDARIDNVRGIALLLMMMVHAAASWQPEKIPNSGILAFIVSGLGGLAAPLFIILVGWGIARSERGFKARTIKAITLLLAQVIVNITGAHLFQPFTPGVLSLISLLILTSPIWLPITRWEMERKPFWIIPMVVIILTMLIVPPKGITWNSMVFTPDVYTLITHLLWDGTYPFFPWVLFAMIGARIHDLDNNILRVEPLILTGLFMFISFTIFAYLTGQNLARPSGEALLTFFPANAPFLISAVTGCGVILWALLKKKINTGTESLGRVSLTFYVLHFIPLRYMHKLDELGSWTFETSMMMTLTFTFIWWPLAIIHQQRMPKLSFEHLINRIIRFKT